MAAELEPKAVVPNYRPPAGPGRSELTCEVRPAPDEPDAILEALGYTVVHTIDRWVETWSLAGAALRVEWYPRMHVLLEVEGAPPSIEAAIVGRPAALAVADRHGEAPGWDTA